MTERVVLRSKAEIQHQEVEFERARLVTLSGRQGVRAAVNKLGDGISEVVAEQSQDELMRALRAIGVADETSLPLQ